MSAEASGLDGVIAADTELCHIDGEAGLLVVRGHTLDELVAQFGFEGTAGLLWHDEHRPAAAKAALVPALGRARIWAAPFVGKVLAAGEGLDVVEGLRAGLALLPDDPPLPAHEAVTGAAAVFAAALVRARAGGTPLAPDPALSHAADYLRMMHGAMPDDDEVRAIDAYLATVAEHGFNASTFTARVIASTAAGTVSAVVGALCALKGPLHGGAPGPVLDMLDAIGGSQNAGPWFEHAIAEGERLMGFGHRVYKTRDPRADVLKREVERLGRAGRGRIAFARHVEKTAVETLSRLKPGRRLDTNVEFWTALLLESLAIPREAFTATFAVGRTAGWTAHILEQERSGRLIRPLSRYVGPRWDEAA